MPHLAPRRKAIETLYTLHIRNPNKYTLVFVLRNWASLNARWVEDLKEHVNMICTLRKVEGPTFAEIKATGLSPDASGLSIFRFPQKFDLDAPQGHFQAHILGALERDFERARRGSYHKTAPVPSGRNAGEAKVYGPNMTTRERRLCSLNAPRAQQGFGICWDFNSRAGCRGAAAGGKCDFGLRVCAEPGCFKDHPVHQHR